MSKPSCSGGLAVAEHPLAGRGDPGQQVDPGRRRRPRRGRAGRAAWKPSASTQQQQGGLAGHHQPAQGDQRADPQAPAMHGAFGPVVAGADLAARPEPGGGRLAQPAARSYRGGAASAGRCGVRGLAMASRIARWPRPDEPQSGETRGTSHEPDRLASSSPLLALAFAVLTGLAVKRGLLGRPGQTAAIGGPFHLVDQTGEAGRPERPEGQVERGVLRLHLLPGGLPDDAAGARPDREAAGRQGQRLPDGVHLGRSRSATRPRCWPTTCPTAPSPRAPSA